MSAPTSLLLAMVDLKLIQGLTNAINAGLPKTGPLGTIPPGANPFTPRPRMKADTESQAVVTPQPGRHASVVSFAPRMTIHPEPRVVELPPQLAAPATLVVEEKPKCSVIEPPWRRLPWPEPDVVIACPKVVRQLVDVRRTGTILDVFV